MKLLRRLRTEAKGLRARFNRARSRATFIGITGSSGKSTAAGLLGHILEASGSVQAQVGWNTPASLLQTMATLRSDADFVLAEIGAGAGRIKPMAQLLKPDVALVTMIALEHKSRFRTCEAVAGEKAELVAALKDDGLAVFNGDDPLVLAMAARTSAKIVTFGRGAHCDFRVVDIECRLPERLRFRLLWGDEELPLQTRFVGPHFWLPAAAAAAAALSLGVAPQIVAAQVESFDPFFTRFSLMTVPGGPDFLVDTAKAPWHSLALAFRALETAEAGRKRIVLGHLSDFSSSSQKYRDAYREARAVADQVIFVGNHAHRSKASSADREAGRFFEFKTVDEAADFVRATAIPDELILLKGSVDLHLERIALSFVREVKCWVDACGRPYGCRPCGRLEIPYSGTSRLADSGRG